MSTAASEEAANESASAAVATAAYFCKDKVLLQRGKPDRIGRLLYIFAKNNFNAILLSGEFWGHLED